MKGRSKLTGLVFTRLVISTICAIGLVHTSGTASVAGQTEAPGTPHWAVVMHQAALKSPGAGHSSGPTGIFPPVIPEHLKNPDADGVVETYNSGPPVHTDQNLFFQSLGTNGRACVTCHEPRSAWGVSAASIRARFELSAGNDPIFRPVDGANCDNDDVSTLEAKRRAYSLLLSRGTIRILLPLPDTQLGTAVPRDFEISSVSDPYGCTDLGGTPPTVSVYRRPLPSANLRFLTQCPAGNPGCAPLSIMWDGREPSLASQAKDATLGHAQSIDGLTDAQAAEIVKFESALYDAQAIDNTAGHLDKVGGHGGPEYLSNQEFFIGINDALSAGFDPEVFALYQEWQNVAGSSGKAQMRGSIARGEALFNTRKFSITDVNGLNLEPFDPLGHNTAIGTCTTCHDSPNVGNHSLKLPLNIGIPDANPPVLDTSGLPVFKVACTDTTGPLKGQSFTVTDLGRALITGRCADVGKFKGPILRGLEARAPYFHNGSAATLEDVVNFYDERFSIGLTTQEKADLVAFLKAL